MTADETDGTQPAGAAIEARDGRAGEDRLSSIVAVIIAFTTLIGALVGYLQADASNASSDARLYAEQLSLQALGSAERSQQLAHGEYEAYVRAVEQQTAASNALLRSLYAASIPCVADCQDADPFNDEERFLLEHARWQRLADASLRMSDIDPNGEFAPANDPTFPARYFASAAYESFRLNALQDAENEVASALDARAASYTAILAMLAVSLYLFGLTLAERSHWLRRGFLLVGLALLAAASGWTALTAGGQIADASEEAAAAYASGRVSLLTAYDSAGYAEAEAHFDRAIAERQSFASAYQWRAGSIVLAATPQRTGFASIIPDEALRRARADLEWARDLGLETAAVYGPLGFNAFLEGLQTGNAELIDEGLGLSRRAMELDPGNPVFSFNLAVGLVAAERFEEARAAYREGVGDALYVDAERSERRNDPWTEQLWLGGALTDLAIVERHRPDLAGTIRGFKEQIVGPISAGNPEPMTPSPATFGDVTVDVRPEALQWWGSLVDYDPERDVVSTQWYHRDQASLIWAVLPEVSGAVYAPVPQAESHTAYRTYLDAVLPARCLPPGQYRAEMYVNGRLAATGEFTADFGDLEAFVARDITVGFCRPTAWQALEDAHPGLLDGVRSDDGQYGAYGFRYPLPRHGGQQDNSVSASIIDRALESFSDQLPGTPVYVAESGTSDEYFLGLSRTAWRWYDYGTGWVRAAAGVTTDGAVVVGVVFGPYEWFRDGNQPHVVINSFVPLY